MLSPLYVVRKTKKKGTGRLMIAGALVDFEPVEASAGINPS